MSDVFPPAPETLEVVKISGKIIDDSQKLKTFLADFLEIKDKKILVHGGGVNIDALMERHGMPINKIDGKRITDLQALLATVMQCSVLNARIVEWLNSFQKYEKFAGLTQPGTYINSTKRKIIKNPDGGKTNYKFVGDVRWQLVDTSALNGILKSGRTPVLSPITFDAKRKLFLNSNADGVANAVASAMSAQQNYIVNLTFCSDVAGVLDSDKNLIPEINQNKYSELKASGVITDGMIPKVENALKALNHVNSVRICNGIGRGTVVSR